MEQQAPQSLPAPQAPLIADTELFPAAMAARICWSFTASQRQTIIETSGWRSLA